MLGVNCGCESRKQIIFTEGKPGRGELVILGTALAAVLIAWRVNR